MYKITNESNKTKKKSNKMVETKRFKGILLNIRVGV